MQADQPPQRAADSAGLRPGPAAVRRADPLRAQARVLIVALLPSDAGIGFGRALYYRAGSTPQPGVAQLNEV